MGATTPEGNFGRGWFPPTYQAQRHLTSFLQWRFSQVPSGAYRYVAEQDPDARESEICIGLDTPIDPNVMGKRPAVTVLRGPAAFQGVGFNDLATVKMQDGTQTRLDMVPTTLMVNVLSRIPVEAERLAWFCMEQIWTFREEITRTEPVIHSIGPRPTLSPPSAAGSLVQSTDFEWCVVVVAFPTYLVHSTIKQPLNNPILKRFEVRVD